MPTSGRNARLYVLVLSVCPFVRPFGGFSFNLFSLLDTGNAWFSNISLQTSSTTASYSFNALPTTQLTMSVKIWKSKRNIHVSNKYENYVAILVYRRQALHSHKTDSSTQLTVSMLLICFCRTVHLAEMPHLCLY